MDQKLIFMTLVGMTLVTAIPRILPLVALSSRNLPPLLGRWLGYIPAAVLSAMLLPALLTQDDRIRLDFDNLFFWCAIPTLIVAWRTRSIFGTVITGMMMVALGRLY